VTAALDVRGVEVRIAGHVILDGVDLAVAQGELLALLGPSGCGKTTLLSTVAGFLAPTAGEIAIGGTVVAGPTIHRPPERRSVGFVFQSYALWPHLTAIETVAFPLRAVGTPANQARSRAGEILASLGAGGMGEHAHERGGEAGNGVRRGATASVVPHEGGADHCALPHRLRRDADR